MGKCKTERFVYGLVIHSFSNLASIRKRKSPKQQKFLWGHQDLIKQQNLTFLCSVKL